ncbi:hypothetical protein [Hydrogenophaga sp. ANAO-22]|jgi:hypothetical protein|uniref:hypothetical protein n=1 Tax=Hydrogenophaga sp. ANAO-22 TaxID=3166645 RepID=UPI0036D2EFA8
MMNLYEVIRWGNDSDDVFTGGPNGPDTCFLVRAGSVEQAASLADAELARRPSPVVENWAGAVHLLGVEQARDDVPRVLRGPYIQHAYTHGWRCWHRDAPSDPWVEHQVAAADVAPTGPT